MATLIQTQALFNQQIAQINAETREIERANAERFARIEQMLLKHEQWLIQFHGMLEGLPEAVRQKIGFQKK